MIQRFLLGAVLSTGMLISGVYPALAQNTVLASPATATASSTPATTGHAAEVESHINKLRHKLSITVAETPQWNALAAVMRQNAAEMESLYKQRTRNAETMNAVQILQSYQAFTQAHLTGLNKLIPVFTKLYAVLSPAQKKTADELFENRVAAATGAKKTQ